MSVEIVVSTAVKKLGELAIQEVSSLPNVEEQATRLKGELKNLEPFLEDATKKQFKDERMRGWISDIRDVAYDTEDAIESFFLEADDPQRSALLEEKIESIQKRLKDIDERRTRYGIQSLDEAQIVSSSDGVEKMPRVSPWQLEEHLVGIEEHVETILSKAILIEYEALCITSIVGMGGTGKSTLAKKIYNHGAVRRKFNCFAWVTLSGDFSHEEVLMELLLQLTGVDVQDLPEAFLKRMIHRHLQGKQYFIVFDDVQRQHDWDYIANVFPHETGKSCRLLITSRVHNTSRSAGYVHELRGLDSDQSWQLFLKAAFIENNDGKCQKELEDIGREIVEKCNGLPLAISLMGGLLMDQGQFVSRWERVLKDLTTHLETEENSFSAILEWCYEDLHPRLKSCFLYLSFFKEDEKIMEDKFIALWIAHGIVPQGEGEETMEEIAKGYLDELINRKMIEAIVSPWLLNLRWCLVRHHLHDLAIKRAKEEINFGFLKNNKTSSDDKSLGKARHIAIWSNDEEFIPSLTPNPHLRSFFLCVSPQTRVISSSLWKRLAGCRVLQFEHERVIEKPYIPLPIPKGIGRLIRLKYLSVLNSLQVKFPRSLGDLKNLEVLDIRCRWVEKMPNVIWKLDSLRHIYFSIDMTCEETLRLDTLKKLETLHNVSIGDIVVDHLAEMVCLRDLKMNLTGDVDFNKLFTVLEKLQNLSSVLFNWSKEEPYSLDGIEKLHHMTKLVIDGAFGKFPESFPKNLSHFQWFNGSLGKDEMTILGKLPNLLQLVFFFTGLEEDIVIKSDCFPKLKLLGCMFTGEKRCLYIRDGGLPNLEMMDIEGASGLSIRLDEEENFRTCQGNWRYYYCCEQYGEAEEDEEDRGGDNEEHGEAKEAEEVSRGDNEQHGEAEEAEDRRGNNEQHGEAEEAEEDRGGDNEQHGEAEEAEDRRGDNEKHGEAEEAEEDKGGDKEHNGEAMGDRGGDNERVKNQTRNYEVGSRKLNWSGVQYNNEGGAIDPFRKSIIEVQQLLSLTIETTSSHNSSNEVVQHDNEDDIDSSLNDVSSLHLNIPEQLIPKVGMEFDSEEDAYKFYNTYAKEVGFRIRRSKFHKRDGKFLDRSFCCSAQGTRGMDKRDDKVKCHRSETRFNCKAMMQIKAIGSEKLRVAKFFIEHSHWLASSRKTNYLRFQRGVDIGQVVELEVLDQSGIRKRKRRSSGMIENEENYVSSLTIEPEYNQESQETSLLQDDGSFW